MKSVFTLFFFFCLFAIGLQAQPTYYMSNQTVDDCKGFLLDSENGDIGGNYDHNENYTFSICIPGVPEITLEFTSFCTELNFDYMRFYDGPDTLSAQIGPVYTGEMEPPPITATSGCLTVNFISDPSVTCTGWNASWCVEPVVPEPVDINPIAIVPCEESSLTITFAEPVPCDEITAAAFEIVGPQSPEVTNATPSPCTGGTTTTVILTLASPITSSGNYTVIYTTYYEDPCTETTPLVSSQNFSVIDCPLTVSLAADASPICEGDCTFLSAEVFGGGGLSEYSYLWDPLLPDSSYVEVCPDTSTTYSVTVTDDNGASAVNSILVEVIPAPMITTSDTTICQSSEPFFLSATPPGGSWSGLGIDEDSESNGYYNPDLVNELIDTVTYTDGNGCVSQLLIDYIILDDGTDDAACPGSAPFLVSGGFPTGGVWSGPNIAADGLFTPVDTGSFLVTYTHPNGCSGSKWVNVAELVMPQLDSICQSTPAFMIPVTPFGGMWTGTGIVDEDTGMFDPQEGVQGDNMLVYTINGCVDSINLVIKAIDALWDFSSCPEQAPFIVPGNWYPGGGVWTGDGIVDSLTGLYDPSLFPSGYNDTLFYTVDGCVDFRINYIRQTDIALEDTVHFCLYDDPVEVSQNTLDYMPCCGTWTGAGISFQGDNIWQFDPGQAGVGTHNLTYERNTCSDFITVVVHAIPVISPVTICEGESPINLNGSLPGTWSGPGIINEANGVFDPSLPGVGSHTIYLESAYGCVGEGTMTVTPFLDAVIEDIPNYYCFKDTIINIPVTPAGGQLYLDGEAITFFNPATAGTGVHTLLYSIGSGACLSEASVVIEVGEEVSASVPFLIDSICYGTSITISADGFGGSSNGAYTYTWNQGLGFGQTHFVDPTSTTTYTVTIDDGCSGLATASITIFVFDQIQTSYTTGPAVCFDDTTFASITASPAADYTYIWDSDPPTIGSTIQSYPTTYNVEVINNETGCSIDTEVELPGFDLITANFEIAPNGEDCISVFEPEIQLIDYSVGATDGYWDFGDGSPREPYVFGESISHLFPDTLGTYTIQLYIENVGGCFSEHELMVCIKPEHTLFAPNAMSPNLDGKNDVFQFKGLFIETIDWQIFNRWGEVIYTGKSMDDSWNGWYKGNRVQPGVYVFLAKYTTKFNDQEQVLKGFVTVVY